MSKDLTVILILTLIATLAWIGLWGTPFFRKPSQVSFTNKTVETISPTLRIDIAEEL